MENLHEGDINEIIAFSLFLFLSLGHQHIVKGSSDNKQYENRDHIKKENVLIKHSCSGYSI